MSVETEHPRFKRDAKLLVDMLFEKDLFRERISRDDMNALEDFIYLSLNGTYESEKRITALMKKINNHEN
jgi:hypothetical protein